MKSSQRLGAAGIVAAAFLWGFWPVWARLGPGGARSATVALLVAGVAGLPLALREGAGRAARGRRAWLLLAFLGVLDAGNAFFYLRGLAEGAVAPTVLSHYLAPVLIALAGPTLLGEPRARRTPLALALALAGTAALVASGHGAGGREDAGAAAVRHALIFGGTSALFYAGNVLLSKKLAPSFGNAELLVYHLLVSAAVLVPLTGLPEPALWLWPSVGGALSTLLAGILYYFGLRRIPAERAGVLSYLEPLVAVLVGWAIFGETPSPAAALGGALVIAGGLLAVTDSRAG